MNYTRLIWPRRICPQCCGPVNRAVGANNPLTESTALGLLVASPDALGLVAVILGAIVGFMWGITFAVASFFIVLVAVVLLEARYALYECPTCKRQLKFHELSQPDNAHKF